MSHVSSVAILGLGAEPVNVEADVTFGMSAFNIVGLPDAAVKESKERIRAAMKNSGLSFPRFRVTVNLAPADIKKQGPIFDLAIAMSILLAEGNVRLENVQGSVFVGELGLNGEVRGIRGALIASSMAESRGFKRIFVPKENANEATLVQGLEVMPISSIRELMEHIEGIKPIEPATQQPRKRKQHVHAIDLSDVRGQEYAKRGVEIAASGSHNLLLYGPPGSGKTLLARAIPSILPDLSEKEALEVTTIYSVAGELKEIGGLIETRPFRSPHHSSSSVALVGGGTWPRPGEISLAHRGVLFLDEFPEFGRASLENLRQPLEDGIVTVSRASATFRFPAKFMLVAAMNPCPCGFADDPYHHCTCSAHQITNYKKKLSGPLIDRIDLSLAMPKVDFEKLMSDKVGENSEAVRKRVENARKIQQMRFARCKIFTNSEMSPKMIRNFCALKGSAASILQTAMEKLHLSARAYTRTLKLARTIADLDESEVIQDMHITEALTFRPNFEM